MSDEPVGNDIDLTRDGKAIAKAPPGLRTQVLALSGGGYRGLFTVRFLRHVEESFKISTRTQFDLLIGTSMGSLVASALALDVKASVIVEKIIQHGDRIFPGGGSATTKGKQLAWEAPYKQEPLRKAIVDTIGADAERPLAEIDAPLAICAINYTQGRPEVFRSRGLAKRNASQVPLIDAVLASAAAPTYFPVHEIGPDTFIDGGLIANAPEMQGVTEAIATLHRQLRDVYVLAIGTASRKEGAALVSIGAPSVRAWLMTHGLFEATLAAQEALAREQCRAVLGQRYLLVDKEPLENQVSALNRMDITGAETTKTLQSLADAAWAEFRTRKTFRRFFS